MKEGSNVSLVVWLIVILGIAAVTFLVMFGTAEGAPLSPTLITSTSGEQQYVTPQSPEEFVPLAQAFIKKRAEAKANKDAGGGGGGGSVDYDIPPPPDMGGKFSPVVTLLPYAQVFGVDEQQPYVPEGNTVPTVTVVNVRDYETVRMYRAWLVEDGNADTVDIRYALFYVYRIVNAPITGEEGRALDLNELSNPTLHYFVLDRDGKLKRSVPVRGMIRDGVIRFGFRSVEIPKLYLREGDKLVIVLDFSLKSKINGYERTARTIAPAIDLLDSQAYIAMEYNLRGSFNEFGWQDRAPALPWSARAGAVIGKPQENHFFMLNPYYGTAVFGIYQRCEAIFPGDSSKLIAHMPIRAQGRGGIWQVIEQEWIPVSPTPEPFSPETNKDGTPYSFLTDLKLVIDGTEYQGIRIEKENGVVWLFDMSQALWSEDRAVEKQVDVHASLATDANPETYTELYFSSISIGWESPVALPRGFTFGNMSWYNGLWNAGDPQINTFGISIPHKIRTDDGGKG